MGTPAFSAEILNGLIQANDYEIVAVYSQPPRPKGRGKAVCKSPVHELAEVYDLPVETPLSLKTRDALRHFQELKADLAIVVAYGLILPEEILEMPKFGCLNIHTSALPRWRGAAPIQHAIWAGDTETAVSFMKMDAGLDTGPVYQMVPIGLNGKETTADLYAKMAQVSVQTLPEVISKILLGQANPSVQPEQGVSYASKIDKQMARIDWQQPAAAIERQIRAMNPSPIAWCLYKGQVLKIYQAEIREQKDTDNNFAPGEIIADDFDIACGRGVLRPVIVQKPGGKPMPREDFLRGFKIQIGDKLA
tara:strand:+ start:2594 stop:3511 length:918 start_codon:yes stop_codon:yes gene_type:complete